MPAQTSFTVNDLAVTNPLDTTFLPRGVDRKGVVKWESAATAGFLTVNTVTASRRVLPDGYIKDRFVVTRPVMETPQGSTVAGYVATPKQAYVMKYDCEVTTHIRSDADTRSRFFNTARGVVASSMAIAQVKDGDVSY